MLQDMALRRSARPQLHTLEERITPANLNAGFAENTIATGLVLPTSMTFAPDGRLFVTEKGGTVRVIVNNSLLPTPFLTLNVSSNSERGLQSIAFDPDFATNRNVYVYYTTQGSTPVNRVSRFTADPTNRNVAQPSSELVLLDNIPSTNGNHNGGAIHFGNDGFLYVATGDAGVTANSQDLSSLAGKMLRINARDPNNLIPADNPFLSTSGARPEVFALGFRNPFTFDVDPATGRIYVNDVGQSTFEEVNELQRGGNYGWPNAEGPSNNPAFINPVFSYGRGVGGSITGGTFYRGNQFPAPFNGAYLVPDFNSGIIQLLPNGVGPATTFATGLAQPVDLDVAPDGSLFTLELGSGTVKRIISTGNNNPGGGGAGQGQFAAGSGLTPRVASFNGDGSARLNFFAYDQNFQGGVRTAMGDINNDGVADIITGVARNGAPHVKVFDGVTGSELRSFFAFDAAFTGGVTVAAGDFNRDGVDDIVVGAARGGAPHVKVFDGRSGAELMSFFAYASNVDVGVNVAAGDFNNDGVADVATSLNFGVPPHVKIFSGVDGSELRSFFAYDSNYNGGVNIAAGDVNNDGVADLITAAANFAPHVQIFSGVSNALLGSFFAPGSVMTSGVRVGAAEVNADPNADVLIASTGASNTPATVTVLDGTTVANAPRTLLTSNPFGLDFNGGIFVS